MTLFMYRKFIQEDNAMVNQVPSYNSAFVSDAMKYLQHAAVVEHKDSITEDIKSSLSMAPLIALPSALSAKKSTINALRVANGEGLPVKVKKTFGEKLKGVPKGIGNKFSNAAKSIGNMPSNISSAFHNATDGQALTRATNVFKSGDGVLYLDDLSNAITTAAQEGKDTSKLVSLRKELTQAVANGDKTDDIIKNVDKALKETAQAGKKGIFSKMAGYAAKPFKWLGGKITSSGAYKWLEGTKYGGQALSKLGGFAKVAKKGGAVFDLVIEGGAQLFGEVIPAFKNGGVGAGIKQLGKSSVQVAGSVGGWALGASLGTKAGAAIGTAICPGIGTAAGAVIGAVGGIIGGLIGSSLFSGIAKKITGKSENDKIEEKQLQQQAAMVAGDSASVSQLQSAVAQQVQYDIASGNVTEDTQKMMGYLQTQGTGTSQPSFGSLTTGTSSGLIATNPDGSFDFSVPQNALPQINYSGLTNTQSDPLLENVQTVAI